MKPADIVALLEKHGFQIGEGTNTRLTNDQVATVNKHLGITPTEGMPAVIDEKPEEAAVTTPADDPEESIEPAAPEVLTPEVIRVERVELSGLKVLGKIDLPEPKTPAPEQVDDREQGADTGKRRDTREKKGFERKRSGNRKNPVAFQRERESEALRQKKIEEAAEKKERRTRRYYETVKQLPPTKPARIINDPVERFEPGELATRPRTWFGRVLYWLTHAND
jgi:hypothetical protein